MPSDLSSAVWDLHLAAHGMISARVTAAEVPTAVDPHRDVLGDDGVVLGDADFLAAAAGQARRLGLYDIAALVEDALRDQTLQALLKLHKATGDALKAELPLPLPPGLNQRTDG